MYILKDVKKSHGGVLLLVKLQVDGQKVRIHCEIFLSEHFLNTYLTIVSLCKLPRNVYDILFETFHEI